MRRFRVNHLLKRFVVVAAAFTLSFPDAVSMAGLVPGTTSATLIATTQSFFSFEGNTGGSWGTGTTWQHGNLDSSNPSRTVWKLFVSQQSTGAFLLLNGLNVTSAPNQKLVFEVRGQGSNERFTIKLESNGGSCTAEIPSVLVVNISSTYQLVQIPLSQFNTPCLVQPSNMHAWTIFSTNTTPITLYFDNMRFE